MVLQGYENERLCLSIVKGQSALFQNERTVCRSRYLARDTNIILPAIAEGRSFTSSFVWPRCGRFSFSAAPCTEYRIRVLDRRALIATALP